MLRIMRSFVILAIAGCLILAQSLMASEGTKGNLVNAGWLEKHLKSTDILILDASPKQLYSVKHIPGAVNVDLFNYGIKEVPLTEMEQRFQSWGISPGKKIIIYDQGGSMMATRIFFDLYYHGMPVNDLFVLDGGLSNWQKEGFQVTKDITPVPEKGSFKINMLNEAIRVRLPEFLGASGDRENTVLVDALDASWHFGEILAFDRAGHIPNSILLSNTDFYNADKTFKSTGEIKRMLSYFGIRSDQQIYTYCGGGVAASVPFFAIKILLGYPKVKLYKESEMGWLKDERELPYWTYDSPFLMRETNWLQSWGGQRMKMYGASQVSIVDVRPAEAFRQGHVPLALNLPAESFKYNITNAGKLAEILGAAGIDASDEAVVISGVGLSKEAALAFVMLEKLGQKKVSVFMDTMDKWAQLGFSVIKDTAGAGTKAVKSLQGTSKAYSGNFHKDVIITDTNGTHGIYSRVYVASGKDMSSKVKDGKVVHVPYTELLKSDGRPKAAKDIWNILSKAGVPRYADLICYSDDPAEAAVNYFILKLMGYPDIKILVN